MVRLLVFACCLSCFASFAQEDNAVYSVYFKSGKAKGLEQEAAVNSRYYQHYLLEEDESNDANAMRRAAGDKLIADESGVYIEKNKLLFITRTEVRENPKYMVRNGYLFGVVENDSVLVAPEDEKYYFLIPSKSYLYNGLNSENFLYKGLQPGDYLVLTPEESYYSALYIRFNANGIELMDLTGDNDNFDLRNVKKKEVKNGKLTTYIIEPSKDEWKKIMNSFDTYDTYLAEPSN